MAQGPSSARCECGYLPTQLAAAGKSNLFEPLVFPDYNHFIPWEHPDAVEAAIRMVTAV